MSNHDSHHRMYIKQVGDVVEYYFTLCSSKVTPGTNWYKDIVHLVSLSKL